MGGLEGQPALRRLRGARHARRGRRLPVRAGSPAQAGRGLIPLGQALLLGALQGPAELLPLSSSGLLALAPRLAGWSYAGLPADRRKSLEVALHAGSAPAVAVAAARRGRPRPREVALTFGPPALAGLAGERLVEERLGGVRTTAAAQIVAGALLLVAARRPAERTRQSAADELAVGLAQAAALVPGVSRYGAALTVCRMRGLDEDAAASLALRAALPVTAGAAALKTVRELQRARRPDPALLAGAAAACASGLAALPLAARRLPLRSIAVARITLGVAALTAWRRQNALPDRRD